MAHDCVYSTANPHVSSTAHVNLSTNFSYDSYGGISMRLKLKRENEISVTTTAVNLIDGRR